MYKNLSLIAASAALVTTFGCLSVKTEHAVKPIEINMNINLKVDKAIDDHISADQPVDVIKLLRNGSVGMTNHALLEPRKQLSVQELNAVNEFNVKRKARFEKIAEDNNETYDAVAKRAAKKIVDGPLSKGAYYQTESGEWVIKN